MALAANEISVNVPDISLPSMKKGDDDYQALAEDQDTENQEGKLKD